MFNDYPTWLVVITVIATIIGYAVFLYFAVYALRPLARGLSYGLWETVVFYKCGVSMFRVFKRFLRAVFIDFPFWGFLNTYTTSITNNVSSWHDVFAWRFEKSFTRANSIRERKANKTPPVDIDDELEIDDDFS